MSFRVGDKVVYPHHGAATIEKKEKKDVFGEKKDYLILKLAYGDLTLMVPADNAEDIGLRDVINDEEVEEVFAVLRKKEARMPTNWSRRFKNHVEKLKSGDIYQVAEVVRNLSLREKEKGLSAGEKRMLAKARQILVSELTFAINVNEEEAETKLDEAVVPVVPVTDTLRARDGATVDRTGFVAVQTPQGFTLDVLRRAHGKHGDATDDAALAEAVGAKVSTVDGDLRNIKITEPWHL